MALNLPANCPIPLLVIFSHIDGEVSKAKKEIEKEGFEVEIVQDRFSMIDKISSPRCFGVVLNDPGNLEALKLLQSAKSLTSARWILFSKDTEKTFFRTQAYGVGAAAVFGYPLKSFQLISEASKIFSGIQDGYINRVMVKLVEQVDSKYLDLPKLDINNKYSSRRNWPKFSEAKDFKNLAATTMDRISSFDKMLQTLVKEIGEPSIRFRLISFGIDSPIIAPAPKDFVVLSSNQPLHPYELITPVNRYPEIMGALVNKSPVYVKSVLDQNLFNEQISKITKAGVRDVAAVPLFNDNKIFGMFLLRFSQIESAKRLEFMRDFGAYARDITPLILDMDFFARLYRSNSKIIQTKRTAT